jgi:HD-GYP domain-containing protein (c-di-GMP phosphodiesterase class II)
MKISARISQLDKLIKNQTPVLKKLLPTLKQLRIEVLKLERQIEILSVVGAELNTVQEQSAILKIILRTARELTNADGGTVYIIEQKFSDNPYDPGKLTSEALSFEVLQNETLNIFKRSTNSKKISLSPVPLKINGKPNHTNVSAYCANTGEIVNISDVYHADGFDFSGTKKYDETTGYRSKSMLVIPLRDHEKRINGVLQLINRQDSKGEVIAFDENDEAIVQSLSYQTAVSLTTQNLLKEQVNLFNSFVRVLAEGLGEKSSCSFGHINRVAHLTVAMAKAVDNWDQGIYNGIHFNEDQNEELKLSGWMHDIGKLTTPEHIVSKSVKLKTVFDRIELVAERFNSKVKELEINALKKQLEGIKQKKPPAYFTQLEEEKQKSMDTLEEGISILCKANIGGEFLPDEIRKKIEEMSQIPLDNFFHVVRENVSGKEEIIDITMERTAVTETLLSEYESSLLLIKRGTLSDEEREIINEHADRSWRWLTKLPFPQKMRKLPLYAGAHHETLNGTGYPNKLNASQLPIQSRIIAIVDIFEALTASDRPYKKPLTLSSALNILGRMVKNGALDAEIVKIFLKTGLYLEYANEFLNTNQIDEVDIDQWLEIYYPQDFKNTLPASN